MIKQKNQRVDMTKATCDICKIHIVQGYRENNDNTILFDQITVSNVRDIDDRDLCGLIRKASQNI